jgi:predicted MFS family arabinose efflux permease
MPLSRTLVLLWAVVVCIYSNEGFINVILPAYLQHQSVALAHLGGIVAAMHVAALASRIPAGLLYRPDRANWYVALAAAAVAAATFAYPRTDSELALGALRLVHGFAFGIATTLNMAQFFDVRPRGVEPGRAMGVFATFLALGFLIGGFLGGFWADTFGFESAFTTAALFPFAAALLNLRLRHAPATGKMPAGEPGGMVPTTASRAATPASAARPPAGATRAPTRPATSTLRASLAALRNPSIVMAALLLFCTNLLNQAFIPFFTLYALQVGLTLTVVGTIMGVGSLFALLTRPIAGELSRWWSYPTISRGAMTLSAVVVLLVPATAWAWMLGGINVAVQVLRSVLTVTGGASVINATDTTAEQRGVASGLFNMGKDLGSILGPLLGGLVAAQVGVALTLPVMAVATLVLFWSATLSLAARLRRAPTAGATPTPAAPHPR